MVNRKVLFAVSLLVLTAMLPIPQGYGTVYQDHVNAGWVYPDCQLWVAIDTPRKLGTLNGMGHSYCCCLFLLVGWLPVLHFRTKKGLSIMT